MQKFDTTGPISAVLDVLGGHVEIIAGDHAGTIVEVKPSEPGKGRDVKLAEQTTAEYSDGVLRIQATVKKKSQILGPSGSVDVIVHLPAGSHVEAKAAAAGFRSTGRLGDVVIEGAYGIREAIRLEEAASARLTAHAGDITVGRLGGSAQITTSKGDISVAEAVEGTLELRTQVGDVKVDAAGGSCASLDAGTGYGRVHNALRNTDAAAGGLVIHATTLHGDITARSL